MIIYNIIWLYFLLSLGCKRYKSLLLLFSFLVLLFLYSFRGDEVGVDTSTYLDVFKSITNVGYLDYIEPLWNAINLLVVEFSGNFNLVLFLAGCLTLIPVYIAISKFSVDGLLSIYIYFSMYLYCGSFNIMRQYISLSLLLLAYCYYKNRKYLFWLFFLFALGFHTSSVFFLLIIPFSKVRITKNRAIITLILSFFIGTFLCDKVVNLVLSFVYGGYAEKDLFRSDSIGFFFVMLMDAFFLLMTISSKAEVLNDKWGKLFLLSALVLNLTYPLELGARIYLIFAISNIFMYPLFLRNSIIHNNIFLKFCIISFFAIQYLRLIISNANGVCPYSFHIY